MIVRLFLTIAALVLVAGGSARGEDVTELKKMMLRPLVEQEAAKQAPEPVVTRGWANKDFGRVVFDWDTPVTFKARIIGDQLRITFDRPLKTKLDETQKKLSKYFSDLKLHGGNQVITGNLRGYYTVRSFANENAVVIDLLPVDNPSTDQAEDPDAWLKRLPVIPVRAGEHPGFGRLVFDWSDEVGYELEKEGKFVRVRFDRPARIDLSRLTSALRGRVMATTSETKKSEVYIALMVPPDADIRHFRDGRKVAIDIISKAPPPEPEQVAARVAESAEQLKARTSTKALAAAAEKEKSEQAAAQPLSLTKKALRAKRAAELDQRRSAKKFKGAPLVTLDATRRGPALDINFNWRKPVSAAVYRRGEYIWVLFNDRARFSIGSLGVIGEDMIDEIEQTDASTISLMKMRAPVHLMPAVKRKGTVWSLRLAPARMTRPIEKPIEITSERDSEGRSTLLLGARGIDRPHVFKDRVIGDVIRVYTVPGPGIGNRVSRRLVDIEVLSSAVGIAVVPRRDDVRFVRSSAGLHVSAPEGLSVSLPNDVAGRVVEHKSEYLFSDIASWSGGSIDNFEKTKHLHLRRILVAPEDQRNEARLNLARFYIANGMAADAMGVIDVVLKQNPKLAESLEVRALRGAAHYQMGHYALAAREFDHPDMVGDPSVAPWRGGIAAARGDWLKSYQIIREARGIVLTMPGWLRTKFMMTGAEAALAVKDIDTAKPWLDGLRNSPLREDDKQVLALLTGHATRLEGKQGVARSIWRDIAEKGNRSVRARAKFALVNSDLESGLIRPEEAIKTLEALSFSWRGDAFEFDLKRRLADLYSQTGDNRTSLMRLRQAASHFKDVDGAEAIAEDMRKRFRMLFIEGGADKLEPVRALALYEEFRELTPPGVEGDEMIRKLADRLVKVDLLAEAARLLKHQVKFRLTGLERSRVGARLALIDLLNRKPVEALEALKLSDGEELPASLEVQRRYLMVRALGASGNLVSALENLSGDVSHEAELLRLGLFWQNSKWQEVAKTVRRLIPQQQIDQLSPKRADMVLRWAVALTMENDLDGLVELRDRFGAAMKTTKYNDAFRAIVGIDTGVATDFKSLVKKTGDLKDFQAFMAGYRDQIRNNALSSIN